MCVLMRELAISHLFPLTKALISYGGTYLLYTPYLLRDSHPVSGVRVSTIQLGLHPAPHSHGVGVLFLQSFSRPLVSHYSLAGAVDYQQQRHNDIIIIIVI